MTENEFNEKYANKIFLRKQPCFIGDGIKFYNSDNNTFQYSYLELGPIHERKIIPLKEVHQANLNYFDKYFINQIEGEPIHETQK